VPVWPHEGNIPGDQPRLQVEIPALGGLLLEARSEKLMDLLFDGDNGTQEWRSIVHKHDNDLRPDFEKYGDITAAFGCPGEQVQNLFGGCKTASSTDCIPSWL
jgi:hypothetical protein